MLNVILGVGLGQLFRGVPSAIVVLLVTPLVVEGLITGLSNVPAGLTSLHQAYSPSEVT